MRGRHHPLLRLAILLSRTVCGASAALPVELLELAVRWQQLDELRAAAGSRAGGVSCHNRRRHALSSLVVCTQAEMVAALLAQRSRRPGLLLAAATRSASLPSSSGDRRDTSHC